MPALHTAASRPVAVRGPASARTPREHAQKRDERSTIEAGLRSAGQPLDAGTRALMEARFGHDFGGISVHTEPPAAASARTLQARAYTVGRQVVFGSGEYEPTTEAGRRLIAHELTHVVQQSSSGLSAVSLGTTAAEAEAGRAAERVMRGLTVGPLGRAPVGLARAPIEPAKSAEVVKKSHQVDLDHLRELLTKMLQALSPKTQARIDRNSTVALGLVEMIDAEGVPFTTLVYTTNSLANTPELEAAAERLGIQHVGGAVPRAETRGESGAPGDAEQLLKEAVRENDMDLLGQAISRPPCKDCAAMIKDEEIATTWLDRAARKAAFGSGRLLRGGSETLKKAVAELDATKQPALTAPGKESAEGLGPDAPVWSTLNSLDVKELYRVFELMQRQRRLDALQAAARKAHGIYNDRLLAVMAAVEYKQQLQSSAPTDSALLGAHWAFSAAAERLPGDQLAYLQRTLQPALRSIVKKRAPKAEPKKPKTEPKEETTAPEKPASSGFGEAVKKGLKAAGVAISALVAFEVAEAIASALFVEFVIGSAGQAMKGAAAEKVRDIVVDQVRKRVQLTPDQLKRVGEAVYHEIEPVLENASKAVGGL